MGRGVRGCIVCIAVVRARMEVVEGVRDGGCGQVNAGAICIKKRRGLYRTKTW